MFPAAGGPWATIEETGVQLVSIMSLTVWHTQTILFAECLIENSHLGLYYYVQLESIRISDEIFNEIWWHIDGKFFEFQLGASKKQFPLDFEISVSDANKKWQCTCTDCCEPLSLGSGPELRLTE